MIAPSPEVDAASGVFGDCVVVSAVVGDHVTVWVGNVGVVVVVVLLLPELLLGATVVVTDGVTTVVEVVVVEDEVVVVEDEVVVVEDEVVVVAEDVVVVVVEEAPSDAGVANNFTVVFSHQHLPVRGQRNTPESLSAQPKTSLPIFGFKRRVPLNGHLPT